MLKILYISALSSERLINEIHNLTKSNPGFAVQKFSRLLVKGLMANGADVVALSNPPFPGGSKRWVLLDSETEEGVHYKYIPFLNVSMLKHLCLFLYAFAYVLFWGCRHRREKAIVCDVLSISVCMGALLASKINGVRSVGVVTDIYGLMVGNAKASWIVKFATYLNQYYVSSFDHYVLLTSQMNERVNPKGKPYIVMEALCDLSMAEHDVQDEERASPRAVIYAGGIHERYGLQMLAEAFVKADIPDARLVYFGSGPYVEEYKKLCAAHPNLEYRGVAPNEEIVAEEMKATLLVNPRPTTEEFTIYSFPSKNMEYMVSGTPLLTTKLPGMPEDYYPHVYLFEEESIQGYADALRKVFSQPANILYAKGVQAKKFVLQNKNYVAQAQRVLGLLEG